MIVGFRTYSDAHSHRWSVTHRHADLGTITSHGRADTAAQAWADLMLACWRLQYYQRS